MKNVSITEEHCGQILDEVGYKTIETRITDSDRWTITEEVITQNLETGKYYSVSYVVGATEYQDDQEFDAYMTEVEPVEITTVVYKAVGNSRT